MFAGESLVAVFADKMAVFVLLVVHYFVGMVVGGRKELDVAGFTEEVFVDFDYTYNKKCYIGLVFLFFNDNNNKDFQKLVGRSRTKYKWTNMCNFVGQTQTACCFLKKIKE